MQRKNLHPSFIYLTYIFIHILSIENLILDTIYQNALHFKVSFSFLLLFLFEKSKNEKLSIYVFVTIWKMFLQNICNLIILVDRTLERPKNWIMPAKKEFVQIDIFDSQRNSKKVVTNTSDGHRVLKKFNFFPSLNFKRWQNHSHFFFKLEGMPKVAYMELFES